MPDAKSRWLWYERTWSVIAALVVFWPIGLALMWAQGKFSLAARIAVSIAAPVLTAALVAAVVLPPRGAAPSSDLGGASLAATISPIPTSLVATTGAQTASTTTSTKQASSGKKASAAQAKPLAGNNTQSAPPPPPKPVGGARFTMVGTISATSAGTSRVALTMTAAPVKGATAYKWWVSVLGATSTYAGQTVSTTYYGLAPDTVLLVVYDAKGVRASSNAAVTTSGGQLSATGS